MESLTANDAASEAEQLMQLELFGLGRLMACIAQITPGKKQTLFRGLLLAAVNDPTTVAVIDASGEVMMTASVPFVASFAGCSQKSIQRYAKALEDVTKDETVNTPAEWSFNLRNVLPAESVPWFIEVVESGDPDCVCRPDSRPDNGVTARHVAPTDSSCRPDSRPDNGATARHLSPENTGSKMSYDLGSYVMSDVTSEPKTTSLSKSDFELLTRHHAAAKASGAKTIGSALTAKQGESNIELGLRCFAAINFADVQRIAGFEVDGVRWGSDKRRQILAAYFADAVKAKTADESEFALFAATMFMTARRKPKAPEKGPDERAGYLRTCWQNRAWRKISTSAADVQAAANLVGDVEVPA